ncbi:hypothetical protein [Clostridium culturomicium]|uniref:hypothetical protein n=1 Tax=Clostridium culturomicium TaxID=1499683 RepID=UPI0005912FA5|nr:hypothetical protein [Clostridium culturomicium]
MWSTYTKTYIFRNCFDEDQVQGEIKAINELLEIEQYNGDIGVVIGTDLMFANAATNFNAFQDEETGEWILKFTHGPVEVATVLLDKYKEVHLEFTIEENLEDGKVCIHCCLIKGFKEYQ